MKNQQHQYIERDTFRIKTEKVYGDKILKLIYSKTRENAPVLFRALMSSRVSRFLGFLNYRPPFGRKCYRYQTFYQNVIYKFF